MTSTETVEARPIPAGLDAIVRAAPNQVSCDLSGESIILDLDSGIYYGLNEVGARVWALVQEPVALRAVLEALLEEYDVDPGRCAADLLNLARELAERGLLDVEAD
jgi:hypothetical protein